MAATQSGHERDPRRPDETRAPAPLAHGEPGSKLSSADGGHRAHHRRSEKRTRALLDGNSSRDSRAGL